MDLKLAFEFEDEYFESRKSVTCRGDKSGDHNSVPYHVKICVPEWYNDGVDQQDRGSSEQYKTLKFSADLSYHGKDFVKAAEQYEAVLDILPQSNSVVRQGVRESLSRCYMHCGETNKSVDIARDLVSELPKGDEAKQRQTLLLLSTVCEKAGRWHECVEALETFCNLQPFWPVSWSRLGDALLQTAQTSPPAVGTSLSHLDSLGPNSRDLILVKALTCFTRARYLCKICLHTANDLVKERNKNFIAQMTERIQSLAIPEEQKRFASSFIPKDTENVFQDNREEKGDTCLEENLSTQNTKPSFVQRFCSWYNAYHNQGTS